MKIVIVVMAGGSGSRLWPISRSMLPKQFLPLISKNTMLQETVHRLQGLDYDSIITLCNEEHRFFVAEQLKEMGLNSKIILEPESKNTAAAITLAALNEDPETLLLVLSADHIIDNINAFHKAINSGIELANLDKLVTFGVVPNKPHTGYGYIKKDKPVQGGFEIEKFVEKPSEDLAESLFKSGNYLWNSGMFLFKAGKFIQEMKKYSPDTHKFCKQAYSKKTNDIDFIRVEKSSFLQCPNISVDYALMEKTNDSAVIPLNAGWSDVGSWSSLWDVVDKNDDGNAIFGDVILNDTSGSYISSEQQLVAINGVKDLVIVSTKDSLLVSSKDSSENIKSIIENMKQNDRPEYEFHREVHRPWGKFDSLDSGTNYQVKRITVKPGAKLSLQKHFHRSEHWVVVSGEAEVTNGDKTFILKENESTYIPCETIHALKNPGNNYLELIGFQGTIGWVILILLPWQ